MRSTCSGPPWRRPCTDPVLLLLHNDLEHDWPKPGRCMNVWSELFIAQDADRQRTWGPGVRDLGSDSKKERTWGQTPRRNGLGV